MSEANKQLVIGKLVAGLVKKFNATPELVRHEHETMDTADIKDLVARRPVEPEPIGHEYFEHLREEGA